MKAVKHQSVKGMKELQEKEKEWNEKSVETEFKRNTLIDLNGKRFHQFWFKFICHPKSLVLDGWGQVGLLCVTYSPGTTCV